MSGISVISGSSTNIYGQIASGSRINSAADDASGLAISQKMDREVKGLDQGTQNADEGVKALNIADGAMAQVTDSLQRVYELSVKAANTFMYGDEERKAMQDEASALLQDIDDMASRTNYNEKNLLDGGEDAIHLATGPDGQGKDIHKLNSTLEALGLKDFDINSSDAISKISKAIENVSGQRANAGAETQALEYTKNYNNVAAENTLASKSRLADLDIPKAVSDKQKQQLLQSYQTLMQKRRQEEEEKRVLGLFNF